MVTSLSTDDSTSKDIDEWNQYKLILIDWLRG